MTLNLGIRRNPDGTLDEIVGTGDLHLEQMDENTWWLGFYPDNSKKRMALTLYSEKPIHANVYEEPPEEVIPLNQDGKCPDTQSTP